jgi:hypothetical protein
MATKVNKYGLAEDDQGAGDGGANPAGIAQTGGSAQQQGSAPPVNPFAGAAPAISGVGAQAVIPEVQQFAFNPQYAAQSQALDRLLANKGQERDNSLVALDQNWQRQRGDAETTRAKALDQMISKYGNSGLLWSTIDAGGRADLQNNFTKFLGDLDINRAAGQQEIQRGYGSMISDVNTQRAGMWGQQQRDEEAARIKAADDARAAKAAEDKANADRQNAEIAAQAARDAAASNRSYTGPTYNPPQAGGGGGGGGLGITGLEAAGLGPNDTMSDLQNQINLLYQQGQTHALSLIYSSPYFQSPNMAGMKKAIGGMVSNMSTPGHAYYSPARPGDSGAFFY